MRYLDASAVRELGPSRAVHAIRKALREGLDPAKDKPRVSINVTGGQFLLMPSENATAAGVKVATVAPGNSARGLPRIHATYLLFDPHTLSLRAALDGTALTTLRTPAVSVAAVLDFLPHRPLRVVVYGNGPQAHGHVETLGAFRPLADVTRVLRTPTVGHGVVGLGTVEADAALRDSDVVVCATSARTPLFDSALLRPSTVVVAVGSHEPDARELDSALLARATVLVEDVATALREAGDVILASAEGALQPRTLAPMRDVLSGTSPDREGPIVLKSVGMSWQDLVVANAVLQLHDTARTADLPTILKEGEL